MSITATLLSTLSTPTYNDYLIQVVAGTTTPGIAIRQGGSGCRLIRLADGAELQIVGSVAAGVVAATALINRGLA